MRDEIDLRSHDETSWIMTGTSGSDSGKFILERHLERILAKINVSDKIRVVQGLIS